MPFFRQLKAISKPPGTRGFEVGFRVLPVFKKSGRGRSRVGKKPARKPVFTVFGYPGISLVRKGSRNRKGKVPKISELRKSVSYIYGTVPYLCAATAACPVFCIWI